VTELNMSNFINLEAEQAVLGAILLSPEALDVALEWVKVEDFYKEGHQSILQGMIELSDSNKPIDLITLTEQLMSDGKLAGIGGVKYLTELAGSVPTAANIRHYLSIVKNKSLSRKAFRAAKAMMDNGKEMDDPKAFIASMQEVADSLGDELRPEREFVATGQILREHSDLLDVRYNSNGEVVGVKTASRDLDRLTSGRQKQDFIIIAARPSVGKTAFMLNDALAAAKGGTTVGIFSLEMPRTSLAERMIAALGDIDGMKLRTGRLDANDWERYTGAAAKLSNLPIYIDDTPGLSVQQIRSKMRAFRKKHGDNIIFYIDYLQLINGGRVFQNRNLEIGHISRTLKQCARDNNCPVVALSQLSRAVEQRQDKRPMMSDLRESGDIEQDADEIEFLYRDDYYNAESEKKNIVEVIVAKGRNTGTGVVEVVYLKNYSKFVDLDRGHSA